MFVAAMAAAGCGVWGCTESAKTRATTQSVEPSPTAKSAEAVPSSDLPVIRVAPRWTLKALDGTELTLSSLRGKVVVLDFWATWCAPCRVEMPDYVKLQDKLRDRGLVIVGLSLDNQGPATVKRFVEQLGVNYLIAMGDEKVAEAYEIEFMPTTYLIDRDGRIRHKKIGPITDLAQYEALITSLL